MIDNNKSQADIADQVPNTNCLEGIRCPRCGSTRKFEILAECVVVFVDNGSDEAGSFAWGDDASIECQNCHETGTVADFKAPEEISCRECGEPVFISTEGTAHHWTTSTDPYGDAAGYVDHDADADHVAIPDIDDETPLPAATNDACILTGAQHEDPDDCTTHPHESDVIEVMPAQLRGGETIIRDAGGALVVSGEVYESSIVKGCYAVENEFGTLYLDAELPIRILSDD